MAAPPYSGKTAILDEVCMLAKELPLGKTRHLKHAAKDVNGWDAKHHDLMSSGEGYEQSSKVCNWPKATAACFKKQMI